MLLRFLNRLFSSSNDSVDLRQSQARPRDGQVLDDSAWPGEQDDLEGLWNDEEEDDAGENVLGFGEESDWDEYGDEIASAAAFASWQEEPGNSRDWDEDEADLAAEVEEPHLYADRWEDWAAVDEVEDDASYQWSEDEEEEY